MPIIAALFVTAGGSFIAASAWTLAQAGSGAGDLAPFVSSGGAVTAVGGIVYIARLMATGRLVARESAIAEAKLSELSAANAALVESVAALVRECQSREDSYRRLLEERTASAARRARKAAEPQ